MTDRAFLETVRALRQKIDARLVARRVNDERHPRAIADQRILGYLFLIEAEELAATRLLELMADPPRGRALEPVRW